MLYRSSTNLLCTPTASRNRDRPPSADALATTQPPTRAAMHTAEIPAASRVARAEARSQSGARNIARSERKPTAMAHAADAAMSRTPRWARDAVGSSARQKSSAQSVESAARSVYGYATPPYAQEVTAVRTKTAETLPVRPA